MAKHSMDHQGVSEHNFKVLLAGQIQWLFLEMQNCRVTSNMKQIFPRLNNQNKLALMNVIN